MATVNINITMKTNKTQLQQGDVIAIKLNKMPIGNQKIIAKGRCVLAHGENGHSHVIEDDEAELIEMGEKILLKLTKQSTLKHEEHHSQVWEPGIYQIDRVVEKDWLNDMVRKVQD